MVLGLRFRVYGSGSTVLGFRCRAYGLGFADKKRSRVREAAGVGCVAGRSKPRNWP